MSSEQGQVDEDARVAKRLDRQWAQQGEDSLFHMLAALGRNGLSIAVGMLVDGVVVRGAISAPRAFAMAADDALAKAVEAIGGIWSASQRASVESAFLRAADQHDKAVKEAREVAERYLPPDDTDRPPPRIDDIPSEDVRSYFFAVSEPSFVDLTQATCELNGKTIAIGFMRIERSHIGAWWPLEEEAGVEVNYIEGDVA